MTNTNDYATLGYKGMRFQASIDAAAKLRRLVIKGHDMRNLRFKNLDTFAAWLRRNFGPDTLEITLRAAL